MRYSASELDQAVEHCKRHIERNRAELERRQKGGYDTSEVATRLKTLEAVKAVHEADRERLQSGRGSGR
jgi:hypothetical protein